MQKNSNVYQLINACVWNVWKRQLYREVDEWWPRAGGRGGWESGGESEQVSFAGDKNALKLTVMTWPHNPVNILKTLELYTLNGWTAWYMNYISIKLFQKPYRQKQQQQKNPAMGSFHKTLYLHMKYVDIYIWQCLKCCQYLPKKYTQEHKAIFTLRESRM